LGSEGDPPERHLASAFSKHLSHKKIMRNKLCLFVLGFQLSYSLFVESIIMTMSKSMSFVSGVLFSALTVSVVAYAAQPHMDNALDALQTAKSELQVAEANKGGHRVNAIRLIDEAMLEVRKGKAFAEK
jgi:hypothetical protein